MIKASELRFKARKALKGNWTIAILSVLITSLIIGLANGTVIGGLIIAGPMTLGLAFIFINIARGKKVILESLFDGFSYFFNSLILGILRSIFIFLWSLLFVIPGIIKVYSYSMSFYIMADNPEMDGSTALNASKEMMQGNKWRLFCLDFSFIGWSLLCILTLGIGYLWLAPYIEASHVQFYEDLKQQNSK